MSDTKSKPWIMQWCEADPVRMGEHDASFGGGCFGFAQIWALRIESNPNETPKDRRKWIESQQPVILQAQKKYEALFNDSVILTGGSNRERSLHRAKVGMANAKMRVDTGNDIHIECITKVPLFPDNCDEYQTARWDLHPYENQIRANTMYFWDIWFADDGGSKAPHACVTRHRSGLGGQGDFIFYDANAGEFQVPNQHWAEFLKHWAMEYANKYDTFLQELTLAPLCVVQPTLGDMIGIIFAEWDAGWWRVKSEESKAAIAKLQQMALNPHGTAQLQMAIRWYARKVTQDPTGALAQALGAQLSTDSTLYKLLRQHFATHPFFMH